MGLFRRKPLHERLAEEGGLVKPAAAPLFIGVIPETGIHGVPRDTYVRAPQSSQGWVRG